jgi:hypothetical protein
MTGKTLSEHYCPIHNTSDGYVDSKGLWNCWSCYKEDMYRNPPGDIIDKYTSKGYVMRLIVSGTHNVHIDIWKLPKLPGEKRIRVFNEVYNFMSQAMRKWDGLVADIDSGTFADNKPKIVPRFKPRLADLIPNDDDNDHEEWFPIDEDRDR